ncbi:TPA: hypothetical protein VA669_001933 [Streptococcus agalactiae]|nr:hypothetical protein [Streptococcus agalactiae]
MNIIKQVKSSFGELEIDFYLDRNRNIFVTIEQLAQRFGYKSRNAIEKMIERQPYLKEKRFSVTDKLSATDGKQYETRLFNKQRENANFKLIRELEKSNHKELTQAIKDWEHFNQWSYKAISDLLLKSVTGQTAKQLKQSRVGYEIALDCLSADELTRYRKLEQKVIVLLELNAEYNDIKKLVL